MSWLPEFIKIGATLEVEVTQQGVGTGRFIEVEVMDMKKPTANAKCVRVRTLPPLRNRWAWIDPRFLRQCTGVPGLTATAAPIHSHSPEEAVSEEVSAS